jgi:predicted acylesterase/phospholipase RssA
VRRMLAGDLVGSPLFRTERVSKWLEGLLQTHVQELGVKPSPNVTFHDLYQASGIELYVVSVDVADRQPRVFGSFLTPDVSVTAAVIASSAIPMAFSPGRLRVSTVSDGSQVHRLIDGGVWANYPAFVFRDASFRSYHELAPVPANSITLGFTLDTKHEPGPSRAVAFESGKIGASRDKGGFLPLIFRYQLVRLYFMTVVPLVIVAQTLYTVPAGGLLFLKDYAQRSWVPEIITSAAAYFDGFFRGFNVGTWSVCLFIVAAAIAASIVGATFLDSGLPAMRTLMSVGTDVPYWIGAAPDDDVVRLKVPAWLRTTTFRLSDSRIAEAVELGRTQTSEQLPSIVART